MLRSSKGRHRAPSKARTVAIRTASVSAVAGAAALGLASPAAAVDEAVWDAVAECESSGNWSINTGNGYYGGLQFSASTWDAFGGEKYADNAHQATKAQQIEIAEATLAGQGWGAWACADARFNASGSDEPAPAAAAPAPARAAAPVVEEEAAEEYTPEVYVEEAAEEESYSYNWDDESDAEESYTAPTSAADGTYTVVSGDTLYKIAQANGIDSWESLFAANSDIIADADLIYPGQVLRLS